MPRTEQKLLAMLLPSFAGGGAEKAMLTLACGFVERGRPVDLLVARAEGPYTGLVDPRVRVVDLHASRVLRAFPRLVSYLRSVRPAALLATLDYANLVALWAHRKARVPARIAVLEQNTISITSRQSRQVRQKIVPRLVRRFYPWAHGIVANSRGVAEDLVRITGLPSTRVSVVYNPVVTASLSRNMRAQPRHPWFECPQLPIVLGAGRLTPQKDFPTLMRAFAAVRQRVRARLVILGEGDDRGALEALAARLGIDSDVSLPGFVDNSYAYMARAAVFVLSSRWEGLPTVLIEALACGTRVIATDCPSGPREILAGGQYGALVPVQNVPALADAIEAALIGRSPAPPEESWRPYELETVVEQYDRLLFDHNTAKAGSATA